MIVCVSLCLCVFVQFWANLNLSPATEETLFPALSFWLYLPHCASLCCCHSTCIKLLKMLLVVNFEATGEQGGCSGRERREWGGGQCLWEREREEAAASGGAGEWEMEFSSQAGRQYQPQWCCCFVAVVSGEEGMPKGGCKGYREREVDGGTGHCRNNCWVAAVVVVAAACKFIFKCGERAEQTGNSVLERESEGTKGKRGTK